MIKPSVKIQGLNAIFPVDTACDQDMRVADDRFTSFSFWLAFSRPCAVYQEASSVCLRKVLAPLSLSSEYCDHR